MNTVPVSMVKVLPRHRYRDTTKLRFQAMRAAILSYDRFTDKYPDEMYRRRHFRTASASYSHWCGQTLCISDCMRLDRLDGTAQPHGCLRAVLLAR
jgi:hypothetical protein